MLFTTEDSEFSWWQFPWTSVHYGVILFVSQLIKFFLSLYNVTDRKERVGVQRNSFGFKLFFLWFRYNATFIDLPVARFSPGKMIHETQVVDAMRGLVENLKQQARTNLSIEDLKDSDPDLK